MQNANCRPLALSSGANVGKRKHSSVSAIRAPPPFYHPKFENLNDFRVYKSWRQLIFFWFFRGEISQSFGLKFSNNKYSFVIFFFSEEAKINNCFWEMNFQRK
jgi:hypothetical protein